MRMVLALPYGTFGIWRAFGLLLNYRISRNSNREEGTVLLLQIPGWGAEMQTCGLFRAYENECFEGGSRVGEYSTIFNFS